jgi:hypothetical protein
MEKIGVLCGLHSTSSALHTPCKRRFNSIYALRTATFERYKPVQCSNSPTGVREIIRKLISSSSSGPEALHPARALGSVISWEY